MKDKLTDKAVDETFCNSSARKADMTKHSCQNKPTVQTSSGAGKEILRLKGDLKKIKACRRIETEPNKDFI